MPKLAALLALLSSLACVACGSTLIVQPPSQKVYRDPLATIYGHEMIRTGTTAHSGGDAKFFITNGASGRRALDYAAWELSRYDVIFIGELHGNAGVHHGQLELLAAIDQFSDRPLALSMEHFQRDSQPILDDYLAGKIGEVLFIKAARAWKDYTRDYRPLVEYAKDHAMPVIAANAADGPRRKVSAWRQEGKTMAEALAMLTPQERPLLAREIHSSEGPYQRKFFGFMGMDDPEHASEAELADASRVFSMQCVWDDTMAESIADFLTKHPGHQVVHVAGAMHSDEFLGTVERLILRNPRITIGVVSPRQVADWQSGAPRYSHEDLDFGNYLMLVRPKPTQFVAEEKRQAFEDARRAAAEKAHGAAK